VEECEEMLLGGEHFWNPGYFITSIDFILESYKKLAPKIYEKVVSGDYANAPIAHFDSVILEKIDLSNAAVIKTDMGWSDPGTLYALKEALEKSSEDNVINGQVVACNCKDSLLYNLEKGKIVTAIGLNGLMVVNTEDALLVLPKNEVINITTLISKMKEEGLEKYL
jgi:mannose-1-phosphate guanylyltransferase